MNLTLRTLLAWLDDTLPPNEVREIGKHVAESPLAKELVEKMNRVTRQRRLTVPSGNGADAVDANIVASYLDNQLDSERVVEYEKKCLTSDVHLAEVASVHQVLSLIGQKAKVPIEARHRMYQLVKGRESIAPKVRRGSKAQAPAPVSEPIQPWVTPEPPRRPWIERFGPLAAVMLLMAVLCWSAWQSLTPPPTTPDSLVLNTAPVPEKAAVAATPKPAAEATAKAPEATPEKAGAPETAPAKEDTPEAAPATPEATPKTNRPAGSVGQVEKTSGIVLRYRSDRLSADGRQWERIDEKAALKNQDRLLGLSPFRTALDLGSVRVEMIGECEIWALAPTPMQAARFNLAQGRVVVHGPNPAAPIEVQFAGRTLIINLPAAGLVGLERLSRGEPGATTSGLRVLAPEGEVRLKVDDAEETLTGPATLTFQLPGHWTGRNAEPVPSWVTEAAPPPFDVQTGVDFLKFFRAGRPLVSDLVEALEDDSKEVRKLAISALRAMGEIALVVPVLSRPNDPLTRRAAVAALRGYLAQGPESADALHKELVSNFGPDEAEKVEKLLNGHTAKEAKEEATYTALVQMLGTTDENLLGLRELALDSLERLTGRDDLGYNPDKPTEGKGLKAWKDLLRDKDLHPPVTKSKK